MSPSPKTCPIIVPSSMLEKIGGNKRRRISVVVTNPRSRHIILTRFPEMYERWVETTIERGCDFIPSWVVGKSKIDKYYFDFNDSTKEVIIRRIPKKRK